MNADPQLRHCKGLVDCKSSSWCVSHCCIQRKVTRVPSQELYLLSLLMGCIEKLKGLKCDLGLHCMSSVALRAFSRMQCQKAWSVQPNFQAPLLKEHTPVSLYYITEVCNTVQKSQSCLSDLSQQFYVNCFEAEFIAECHIGGLYVDYSSADFMLWLLSQALRMQSLARKFQLAYRTAARLTLAQTLSQTSKRQEYLMRRIQVSTSLTHESMALPFISAC